jgi:uncharacterized protein (DUF2062 family)
MQLFKNIKANILKTGEFIQSVFSKKTLNKVVAQLTNPNQTDAVKAFSAAFGIFMGIIPIWGLQTLAAIFLAMVFKLNKTLVVLFSQVSLPPLLPLIVLLSYRAGRFWIGNSKTSTHINTHFVQYIYGSITLAVGASVITGLLTFVLLRAVKMVKQYRLQSGLKKAF